MTTEPLEQNDGFDAVRRAYPPMLSTAQVAELLDLNPRTVLAMAGDGRLRPVGCPTPGSTTSCSRASSTC